MSDETLTDFVVTTFNSPRDWIQIQDFDGTSYQMRFQYNERDDSWYMSLSDQNDVAIVSGIRLVLGVSLLDLYRAIPGLPPGDLYLFDTTGSGVEMSELDLGDRVLLMYQGVT